MQELLTPLGRVYLTVETDEVNRWIFTDWKGYLTVDSVQNGATAYTVALANAGFSRVLNDTRAVRGPWDHSMDWVLNVWAPQAAQAGLKYFAMVTSPETLADSSAANFYAQLTAFHAEVFDTVEAAQN